MDIKSIDLSYGKDKRTLSIPEANLAGFIKPISPAKRFGIEEGLNSALHNAVDGIRLEDLVCGKKVCVTVEDYSRFTPHREVIQALSGKLGKAKMVQYIVATGTHNPMDERNLKIKSMIEDVASSQKLNFSAILNASREKEQFEYAGRTSSGTDIWVNKASLDADLFIVASDMKPHYFAGYSAANKHFLPGICGFETIRANHCGLIKDEKSNYGRHPWHYDQQRRDNPLASDMLEAMEIILDGRPAYALAIISEGNSLLWSQFGPIEPVVRTGIKNVDEIYTFKVKPAQYMVVSPGGLPEDISMYVGQRAPELTLEAVKQGGEVLWLSECSEGIHTGEPQAVVNDFHNCMMSDLKTLSEMLDQPDVKFHTYKAYRFRRMLEKVKIYGYSSLDNEILRSVDIIPVKNPQEIIDAWIKADPNARILMVDKANKIAIYGDGKME